MNNFTYKPGGPGDIVVVRLLYEYPVYVSLLGLNLADMAGGKRLIVATQPSATSPTMRHIMLPSAIMKFARRRLVRLAKDERGVSAVEFAMLLPLMMTLFFGGVEVSQGVSIDRKVTLTARTVTDLVSQVASINNAGMNGVLQAATAVLSPYPTNNAKVTVSVLKIDANSKVTVDWSDTLNGTARQGLDRRRSRRR